MKISFQPTPEDLLASRWVAMRPRPIFRWAGWVVLAVVIFFFGVGLVDLFLGRHPFDRFWTLLVIAACLGLAFFWFWPRHVRKIFRQQKGLQRPREVEFGDTNFSITVPNGFFTMPWTEVHKWKQGRKCLLIYHSDAAASVIPCRAFPTDADRAVIVQLLQTKVGKETL